MPPTAYHNQIQIRERFRLTLTRHHGHARGRSLNTSTNTQGGQPPPKAMAAFLRPHFHAARLLLYVHSPNSGGNWYVQAVRLNPVGPTLRGVFNPRSLDDSEPSVLRLQFATRNSSRMTRRNVDSSGSRFLSTYSRNASFIILW